MDDIPVDVSTWLTAHWASGVPAAIFFYCTLLITDVNVDVVPVSSHRFVVNLISSNERILQSYSKGELNKSIRTFHGIFMTSSTYSLRENVLFQIINHLSSVSSNISVRYSRQSSWEQLWMILNTGCPIFAAANEMSVEFKVEFFWWWLEWTQNIQPKNILEYLWCSKVEKNLMGLIAILACQKFREIIA